ncbi:sugar-binding transcriptional regulator [Candidatus Sordicultor fermentans]|uniref:sugar-binding transcriptional regulator n=1 Tax=Candidatus Sordicultor fermentans TaxID=1953203 RepID=UPI00390895FA
MVDDYSEYDLMGEVARMYYYDELTQDKIGEILGLSRQKVWRILRRAREEGIVQIRVEGSSRVDSEIEDALREDFGLKEVEVARVFATEEKLVVKKVAQLAASYLKEKVEPYISLGVAYGRTLFEMTNFLPDNPVMGLRVIQIMGGYGKLKGEVMAVELARKIAEAFQGDVVYLLAPAFAQDPQAKEAIENQEKIKRVMDLAKTVDIALVGIGGVSPVSTLMDTGEIYPQEREELLREGAVGNICGNFYDIEGNQVESSADKRRISISLEDLKKIPVVIGVAGGKSKLEPILGALRGKLINVLITDELTARDLVKKD